MQNSQRVLLAKPRTAPMARRRDGDIAPYRNGTAPRGTGGAHDGRVAQWQHRVGKGVRNETVRTGYTYGNLARGQSGLPKKTGG